MLMHNVLLLLQVTSKQDAFFTLSKLSGHVPYSFVCSNCTRFEDISDVIVATARTGRLHTYACVQLHACKCVFYTVGIQLLYMCIVFF